MHYCRQNWTSHHINMSYCDVCIWNATTTQKKRHSVTKQNVRKSFLFRSFSHLLATENFREMCTRIQHLVRMKVLFTFAPKSDPHPLANMVVNFSIFWPINYHHVLVKLLYTLRYSIYMAECHLNFCSCFFLSKIKYVSESNDLGLDKKEERQRVEFTTKYTVFSCNQSRVNVLFRYEILEIHFNSNCGV